MSPAAYASRYLPVRVRSGADVLEVQVRRYHLGSPTSAQQKLWSALGGHLAAKTRADKGYRIPLVIDSAPFPVESREQIRMPAVRPFWGKGSPEDCQVVFQLALLLGLTTARDLQSWADANIGLDCNGFVGNYLFRGRAPGVSWWTAGGADGPGPSQTIDVLFHEVAGKDESGALTDLDGLDASRSYIVARTDESGRVIPGPTPVGHVAVTEPGQFIASYSSMDLTRASDRMIGNPALRTVESAGPVKGVGENWMVFIRPLKPKGVFEVNRDGIRKSDSVKIAPLP